jgi:ABC-type lipoprotein release transport system permease subunit
MIAKLTWRNLWRNRRRTIITLASISFAVMLAIVMGALQKGVFDNLIRNVVSFYSGYIQLHKKGYWDEQVIENSFVKDDQLIQRLRGIGGIRTVVPRLESYALASAGTLTRGCLVTGTDAGEEKMLSGLDKKVVKGNYLDVSSQAALVAEGLAVKLKLTVGDTVVLLGQGYQGTVAAGKYPVGGIVHFGSPQLNESVIFLNLATAQQFLGAEGLLTSLVFALDNPARLNEIHASILRMSGQGSEVLSWKQMMPEIENHIRADGIFSTILMMTVERRYEFGMLIAVGMKKKRLGLMLVSETVFISLAGTLIGMVLSLPIVWYLKEKPIRLSGSMARAYEQFGFEAVFPALFDPAIFWHQAWVVLMISFLIGIYPAVHTFYLNPVKAMKK